MDIHHNGDILKIGNIYSQHKTLIILNFILLALDSFVTTYPINLLGKIIAIAAGQLPGGIQALITAGLSYFGFYLMHGITQGLFAYFNKKLESILGNKIRCAVFHHLMYLPYSFFDQINTGDVLVRLTEDSKITVEGFLKPLTFLAKSWLTFILGLYFMLRLNWRLTGIILFSGVIMTYFTARTGPFLKKICQEHSEKIGDLWSLYSEGIRGIRDIQVNGRQEKFLRPIFILSEKVQNLTIKGETFKTIVGTSYGTFYMGIFAFIATYGGWLVVRGSLGIGELTTIMFYNGFLINPLLEFNSLFQQLQRINVSLDRIKSILQNPIQNKKPQNGKLKNGHIIFANVSFAYEPERPVLNHINIDIPSGSRVAIVGESGAGKSTILKLISGIYLPQQGRISVGGLEVNFDNIDIIRNSISLVFQDTFLFNGTLESNIRFANPGASAEEVSRVVKLAEIEAFLDKLPQGLATCVGENGVKLSVGERQRVGLARALLRNPSILLLDEISSALDNITTDNIFKNLKNNFYDCTLVIIAHRLHTIVDVDCIYVIAGGEIVEKGTHRQLMESFGAYRSLYDAEFRLNLSVGK